MENIIKETLSKLDKEPINLDEWKKKHPKRFALAKLNDASTGWIILSARDEEGLSSALDKASTLEPDSKFKMV
ncbi:MAG: hypothetical protein K6E13_10520 [Lachnospiraceae bacterium]|nr:hypothetical protein [Lachnospiraceae bacterium]